MEKLLNIATSYAQVAANHVESLGPKGGCRLLGIRPENYREDYHKPLLVAHFQLKYAKTLLVLIDNPYSIEEQWKLNIANKGEMYLESEINNYK